MKNNHIFPFLWMRGEEEETLRTEMSKIAECGIGAVCVEARPHKDFCREGWWHDMDIILDEAKKRDMKVWILDDKHFPTGYANGLIENQYPERKKLYIANSKTNVCGYPNRLLSLNIKRMLKPAIGFWEIQDAMKNMEERAKNKLLAVIAVKAAEGGKLHENVIDLTDSVKDDFVEFSLPEGVWTVYVIFKTRCDGGDDTYINLIDAESAYTQIEGVYEAHYERYKEEFGKTIAGFFSDEPQFGNIAEVCYDADLNKKKMPLPWSDELENMLKERYGETYIQYLPFLFQETEEKEKQYQIRNDYMDCVSALYKKNFSDAIGHWCEEHGVEYIGHVVEDNNTHSRLGMGAAHYFRAMSGQHMAGIDDIGQQIVFGAPVTDRQGLGELGGDGEFYHYTLAKLGASCGHLDPKKKGRTMCELFGAYGWNFGVRDMKYVLDHLLVRGINELVPHAFSMAKYPDMDCPPHFYAQGNHPEFLYFARLMKYANRMCELFSNGQHVANAAVLYDGEADWIGGAMPMQKVIRQLMENQIDLDIVPIDILEHLADYRGEIKDGRLIINSITFDVLIIPYTRGISAHFAEWLMEKGNLPVYFIDSYPDKIITSSESLTLEKLKECTQVIPLEELAAYMVKNGYCDIRLDKSFKELSFYHYKKNGDIYMFQNESSFKTYKGTVVLPITKKMVCYDALSDRYEEIVQTHLGDRTLINLELAPAESIVLVEEKEQNCKRIHQSFENQLANMNVIDISDGWNVSMVRSVEYPDFGKEEYMEILRPISQDHPTFSGVIRYRKNICINQAKKPEKAYMKAENVYEVMRVFVNGTEAGYRLNPPYQVELTGHLNDGENEIIIEVATTPAREQLALPQPSFDFNYEAVEATGMFGKIDLYI